MRASLRAGLLAAATVAAVAVPASPASAVCVNLHVQGFECVNPCYTVYGAYDAADQAVKDRLPHLFDCLA